MLKVKRAFLPTRYQNVIFVQTMDGRLAYFYMTLPPKAITEDDFYYCKPAFKLRRISEDEIVPNSSAGYLLWQYKIEIDGGKYPAKWREKENIKRK